MVGLTSFCCTNSFFHVCMCVWVCLVGEVGGGEEDEEEDEEEGLAIGGNQLVAAAAAEAPPAGGGAGADEVQLMCCVMLQKEVPNGLVDEKCGKKSSKGMAGLCE